MRFAVVTILLTASLLLAQDAGSEFEVATVKLIDMSSLGLDRALAPLIKEDPGRITYSALTLRQLLTIAYSTNSYQLFGPSWIDSTRVEVVGKVPAGASRAQIPGMLRKLLEPRFHISSHREKKDMEVYFLSASRDGVKLKGTDEAPSATIRKDNYGFALPKPGEYWTNMQTAGVLLRATAISSARLAELLTNPMGRPVIDKTSLTGKYDIAIEYSPEDTKGMPGAMPLPGPPGRPTNSLRLPDVLKTLGLNLESGTSTVEIIVIDGIQRTPDEN